MPVFELTKHGQFLQLSRQNPELFASRRHFTLSDHTQVTLYGAGMIGFEPEQDSDKSIVLSSGIHGNETAPIEICDAMVQDILTGKLQVSQRVLFLFGNLAAMDIAERFIEENMNRLFSGAHSAPPGLCNDERKRALELENVVAEFFGQRQDRRYHYDLHTAIRGSKNDKFAVYPFLHGRPWKISQLQFLAACGVTTFLLSESPTTTFSYFSSRQFGADAFTVELGKVMPFGHNDMSRFAATDKTLRRFISHGQIDLGDFDPAQMDIFKIHQVINKTRDDFKLNFADDALNFTDFPPGYVLAEENGTKYQAEYPGEAIVFPNAKVALGQRALLTVIPTEIGQGWE
ncbi:succinylglutamate desuccinylase [Neptunicella sp. SCSIO 80796]|uniref:succinylglutamate desuccinylase n=1 Tax=Neptunicella plasticusilytica TaxID=3117012 RepID=UPI003A4E3157